MCSVKARALTVGQFRNQSESSAFLKKTYSVIVVLIGLFSFYDAFLVYQYREVIDEHNPFCAWLISREPDYVSLFLIGKGLGTLSVMMVLFFLFRHWSRLAVPVAASLMLFQIGLMGYLHGSDGKRPPVANMAVLSSDTFSPLIKVRGEAVARGKFKNIPRKSKRPHPARSSVLGGQQRLTQAQHRLPSQRLKPQLQNKLVNPKDSNVRGNKARRSKKRVLNLKTR